MTKPFGYFDGEEPEQTEAYIAGLNADLEGRRQRGEDETDVLAELKRMGVSTTKNTRLRGAAKETRA